MLTVCLLSTSALAVSSVPPSFVKDFYSGEQANVIINQGGYSITNGACCDMTHGPGCKIQAESAGSDVREQGSLNRSRSDGRGIVVSLYGNIMKQMALEPGSAVNSTHKWACGAACPLTGDFISSVQIGMPGSKCPRERAKDTGTESITQPKAIGGETRVCERFSWSETIFCLANMMKADFFVDMGSTPPMPFFSTQTIEPLGKPIGQSNISFVEFQAQTAAQLEDFFDVDPDTIQNCPAPRNGCGQDAYQGRGHFAAQRRFFDLSINDAAASIAKPLLAASAGKSPPPPAQPDVTFDKDYTVLEDNKMLINQGGATAQNGDVCCTADVPQCQVQASHQSGTRYHDATNNRSRFEDSISGQTVIAFYGTIHKNVLVNITKGVETCQEYCPIDPLDSIGRFDPFDALDPVTDVGATTLDGQAVEHYRWSDKLFKIIKMQTTDFYAALSADQKHGVPVFATTAITPFGQAKLGAQNQTWGNWTAGVPPASKFGIAGLATCPQSANCGSNANQAFRLQQKQYHSFYSHVLSTEEHRAGLPRP